MTQQKLGFGPSPRPQTIYLNRQYPECLWYFWDHAASKQQPIEHESLTGYLTQIEIKEKEFRGKTDIKLNFHLRCDRAYKIEVGLDTLTAKSLLSGLMKVTDFTQPITIAPEPGDTDTVVFGKIAIDGEIIYAPYPEDTIWPDILQALIDALRAVGDHRLPSSAVRAAHPAPSSPAPQSSPPARSLPTPSASPKLPTLPPTSPNPTNDPRVITDAQRKDFVSLVRRNGWSTEAVKLYLSNVGYSHSSTIAPKDFESVCDGITQADMKRFFEDKATIAADQLGTWEDAA